jgi:hypothetical protein
MELSVQGGGGSVLADADGTEQFQVKLVGVIELIKTNDILAKMQFL